MFGILEILSDYFKIPQINFEDVIDTNITTYLSIVYYLIKICPFPLLLREFIPVSFLMRPDSGWSCLTLICHVATNWLDTIGLILTSLYFLTWRPQLRARRAGEQ